MIVLDNSGDCALFNALQMAAQGNSQKMAAVNALIVQLQAILANANLSFESQCTQIFIKIKAFFAQHSSWEASFLDVEISGFGSLLQFLEVCQVVRLAHLSALSI